MLDLKYDIFIVYIACLNSVPFFNSFLLDVYPFFSPHIAGLIVEEASIKVFNKYVDFADIFFPNLASKHPKHTRINDHAIELVDGQQALYGPIYSFGLIEIKTLKAYIETNLVNGFIRQFKSPIGVPIFFDWKSDSLLWLYLNYRSLNNPTIKNWYLLPLVRELLNRLGKVRRFTQLNLISVYY